MLPQPKLIVIANQNNTSSVSFASFALPYGINSFSDIRVANSVPRLWKAPALPRAAVWRDTHSLLSSDRRALSSLHPGHCWQINPLSEKTILPFQFSITSLVSSGKRAFCTIPRRAWPPSGYQAPKYNCLERMGWIQGMQCSSAPNVSLLIWGTFVFVLCPLLAFSLLKPQGYLSTSFKNQCVCII